MIAPVQQPTRRRFSVREYYKMAEAGILGPDSRVELIDGAVIQIPSIGASHAGHVNRFNRLLMLRLHDVARVAVQNPVHLDDYNEPQPDLALLRSRPDFYSAAHPTPADILALVEVSDTSLAYDRRVKALLYAQHGIPAYLMLDLPRQTLTVFREPSPEGYGSMQTLRRGDHWAPLAFPDRQITVTDLLGEA